MFSCKAYTCTAAELCMVAAQALPSLCDEKIGIANQHDVMCRREIRRRSRVRKHGRQRRT